MGNSPAELSRGLLELLLTNSLTARSDMLGEAVTLMRTVVAASIVPVGWPALADAMAKTLEHEIPVQCEERAQGPVGSSKAI